MAICDSNYMFTCVDVGAYEKEEDSTVFKNSNFYTALTNCHLGLREPRPIEDFESESFRCVIVADEAFALSEHVMRPFGKNSLTTKKKIYNYRHSRVRRYIECAFGILSNKWRIFHRPLNVRTSLAEDIVKASCILHNYVRCKDGYKFEDVLTVEGVGELARDITSRGSRNAVNTRERLSGYFMSPEGEVSWQYIQIYCRQLVQTRTINTAM